MTLIDRYIIVKFISAFLYALVLLMAIIVVFDFAENVSQFMDYQVSWRDIIFGYYINFIPYFFNLFIPLFTFISTIWFTSKLSSNNEIVAILTSGVSFYRFLVPYLIGALIIAIIAIFMSNMVVPHTNQNMHEFQEGQMSRVSKTTATMHIRNSPTSYIYVDRWNTGDEQGYQFSYDEIDENYVKYRISAQEIRFDAESQQWQLMHYTKRITGAEGEIITSGYQMDTIFNITPLDLSQSRKVCETMNFRELRRFIRDDKEKGGGMSKYYIIELHKRIANSLGAIIMTLLGLSVAARKNRRGVGVHLFVGIALAFTFIFMQQISTVFSIYGGFSPALGTWMPNIIYTFICIGMIKTCQK